ncbi:MAG TPA: SOS response-associated peptidase, partial [Longimicrobiales bacterium]|jgi:putative SOS response-associated peptidase YedK
MCGRYSLTSTADELVEVFEVPEMPDLPLALPRYNIAPTQEAPVLVLGSAGRRLGALRWGLVPFWADDPAIGNRLINARSESAHVKPAFREALGRRRCLVLADGFYEWMRAPGGQGHKIPHWIHRDDGRPFTIAGLWERWRASEGEDLHTFTILTTSAAPWMEAIHDRMPAIVPEEARDVWMSRDTSVDEARRLLAPCLDGALVAREVSTHVNRPANDDPLCIEPQGPPG